jgi:tryptophan-rich sensory protein
MTLTIVVAIIVTVAVLGAGGLMTDVGEWYRDLRKPSWNPPNWLFGPAWTLILGLVGWSGVLAWILAPDLGARVRIGLLFGANIVLQVAWSPLFFKFKRPDWALCEVPFLWLSILALMIGLAPLSTLAVWLLSPYLLWVSFATVLNLVIVRMNAPFSPNV